MKLKYKKLLIQDYGQLMDLWKDTHELEITDGDSEPEIKSYLKRNPGMSFVCIDSDRKKIVGSILCGHDGRRGFIYHLAVSSAYRKKFVAKTLIGMSLEKLKERKIKRCIIMAKSYNKSGNDFWKNARWKRRGDLVMYSITL